MLQTQDFVRAKLYSDEQSVIALALQVDDTAHLGFEHHPGGFNSVASAP